MQLTMKDSEYDFARSEEYPQTHSILTLYGILPYIRLGREDL